MLFYYSQLFLSVNDYCKLKTDVEHNLVDDDEEKNYAYAICCGAEEASEGGGAEY